MSNWNDSELWVLSEQGLSIVDVTALDAPVVVSRASLSGVPAALYRSGSTAFAVHTDSATKPTEQTLTSIDLTDAAQPLPATAIQLPGTAPAGWNALTSFGSRMSDHELQGYGWHTIWSFDLDDVAGPTLINEIEVPGVAWGFSGPWAFGDTSDDIALIDPSTDTGPSSRPTIPEDFTELDVLGDVVRARAGSTLSAFQLSTSGPSTPAGSVDVGLEFAEAVMTTRYTGPAGVALIAKDEVDTFCTMCDGRSAVYPQRAVAVDMSNPAEPKVVPGLSWSHDAQFAALLPERLVVAGRETNESTELTLLATNPSAPGLLRTMAVKGISTTALHVLPDAKLVIVTGHGKDPTDPMKDPIPGKVQLVDLEDDAIVQRGSVILPMAEASSASVREAYWRFDRLWLVSATDLYSLDISDRDHPSVAGSVRLVAE